MMTPRVTQARAEPTEPREPRQASRDGDAPAEWYLVGRSGVFSPDGARSPAAEGRMEDVLVLRRGGGEGGEEEQRVSEKCSETRAPAR
jgi:hypothetical protein